MILNINQLRAFYAAATTGSISKAARTLMVTPPAITMQVKLLEESVGIRLLVREGNAIQLTSAGQAVLRKAEKIFQGIQEMEAFLEDMSTGKSGELRIGCPEMPGQYLLPKLIVEFKKAYPGIKVVLDQGNSAEMAKSIEDRRNELVFIRHRPADPRLKTRAIRKEELVLIASPSSVHVAGNEISVAHLSEIPLILTREGSGIREVLLEYFRRFKVEPHIAMELASVVLLKEFVRQDNGVGFVESEAIKEEVSQGLLKVVHVLEGAPEVEFAIGYRKRRELSPAAWAFLRLLEKSEYALSLA